MSVNGRVAFTQDDQKRMLDFLVRELRVGNEDAARGNVLWKRAECQRVTLHSFQAMRDHMRRIILPLIDADKDDEVPISEQKVLYLKRKLQLGSYLVSSTLAKLADNKKRSARAPQLDLQKRQSPRKNQTQQEKGALSSSSSPSVDSDSPNKKRRRCVVVIDDSDDDEKEMEAVSSAAADQVERDSCALRSRHRLLVPVLQRLAAPSDEASTSKAGLPVARKERFPTRALYKRPNRKLGSPESPARGEEEALPPRPQPTLANSSANNATKAVSPPNEKTSCFDPCCLDLDVLSAGCTRNGQLLAVASDATPRPLQGQQAAAAAATEVEGRLPSASWKAIFYCMLRDGRIPANEVSTAYLEVKSLVQSMSMDEMAAAASVGNRPTTSASVG